jgi:hypothetical protein
VAIGNEWYFLTRLGHDIVNIDPPDKLCSLYRREHYRDGATLWRNVSRFVPDRIVEG